VLARKSYREGVALIRKSVAVNPEAHFGREQWQTAIAEFLLTALDDPALLTTYDCLGNRLDLRIEDILNREANWTDTGYGRPYDAAFSQGKVDDLVPGFCLTISLDKVNQSPPGAGPKSSLPACCVQGSLNMHVPMAEPGAYSGLDWCPSQRQPSWDFDPGRAHRRSRSRQSPEYRRSSHHLGALTGSARADKPLEARSKSG
jgi:hypothetical protein